MKPFIPIKPVKLTENQFKNLKPPLYCQPKFDGWRIVILNGKALTYNLKPIPNLHIRSSLESIFKDVNYYLIDGEGLLMDEKATYQDIQSAYSTIEGKPDWRYVMFDCLPLVQDLCLDYFNRLEFLDNVKYRLGFPSLANKYNQIETIRYSQYYCGVPFELEAAEHHITKIKGMEGVILRDPSAPYKFGRSTLREGALMAFKRHIDCEARVIGRYPLEMNLNEQETDNHGHAKRSSKQNGKREIPTLGGLIVEGINGRFKGVRFNIGSGFNEKQRYDLYNCDIGYIPSIVKYKYFEVGSKDKPRQPVFLGFRSPEDL
jgi:DNA ligase 1